MRKVPGWDTYFMDIARAASTRSKDPHTQVGAVLVQENRIIGTGYNGFAPGAVETPALWERPLKYDYVIHAELNCILHAVAPAKGSTLYTTMYPCKECAKLIASAGIQRIVYCDDKYKNEISEDILSLSLIEVEKLN
jgi:dCMP deaminase